MLCMEPDGIVILRKSLASGETRAQLMKSEKPINDSDLTATDFQAFSKIII